jgi:hypothetical protein
MKQAIEQAKARNRAHLLEIQDARASEKRAILRARVARQQLNRQLNEVAA